MMGAAVKLTVNCARCGEDVEISGQFTDGAADGFGFRSDEAGTKTAWDHQAKHDEETENA